MKWFNNLRVRSKFLLAGLLILSFLLILAGTGVWGVATINRHLQQAQSQQVPSIYELALTNQKLQATRVSIRQALAETDTTKIQQEVDKARQALADGRQHWEKYKPLPTVQGEKDIQANFEMEWRAWTDETNQVLQLALANTPESHQKALETLNQGHGQTLVDILSRLTDLNYEGTAFLATSADTTFWWTIGTILAIGLVVVLVTLGTMTLLAYSINRPLRKLHRVTQALATGDLTQRVEIDTHDELGELGSTYNTTLASLQELVRQLYRQSQQVNKATGELTTQARAQVADSTQQASAIAEATHSLQELSQTAELIAQETIKAADAAEHSYWRAQSVSELADLMAQTQQQGQTTVAQTIQSLASLKEQISQIEEQQQLLLEQSGALQKVIKLIDSIAKETHLLALNASIEAAGAGVLGQRFAVIAEQVKELAARSLVATQEVRGTLGGISLAIENSSQRATHGLREAEAAVEQAHNSNMVLVTLAALSEQVKDASRDIVTQVQGTAGLTTNIGIATRQQQVASHEMLEKMQEIEEVTRETLNHVREGEAATYQLSQSARQLEYSADTFKLAEAH